MTDILFLAAGGLSALWLVVHLFAGGPQIAKPLRETQELDSVARDTLYLCWHFTSVAIACMAGLFFWAALADSLAFATAGSVLATGFAVIGISLVIKVGGNHMQLPQGWLFVPVAALGLVGHLF